MKWLFSWDRNNFPLQLSTTCLYLWHIKHSTLSMRGENWLIFLLLWENDFFLKFIFLGCWSSWLLVFFKGISYFTLLSFTILLQSYELDSPFTVSWNPILGLMAGDLWLLRILFKILVLSWNLKSLSFSSNLPFRTFTSAWYFFSFSRYYFFMIFSDFLPSSTFCFNLRISFSCSSSVWGSSSFYM